MWARGQSRVACVGGFGFLFLLILGHFEDDASTTPLSPLTQTHPVPVPAAAAVRPRHKRKHGRGNLKLPELPEHWPPVRAGIDPHNLGLNFSLGDEAALGLAHLPPKNGSRKGRNYETPPVIPDDGPPHFLYLFRFASPNPLSLRWKYRDHYECMLSGMSREHLALLATVYNMTLFTPGWVCEMRRREVDWRGQFNRSCDQPRAEQERKGIEEYCAEATRYRELLVPDPSLRGRPLSADFSPVMSQCLKKAKGCAAWLIPMLYAYDGAFLFCCALHGSISDTFQWLTSIIPPRWRRDRAALLRTEPTIDEQMRAVTSLTVAPLMDPNGSVPSSEWLVPPDYKRILNKTTLDKMLRVHYGTQLAVHRHGGVIPAWDIDIDLRMDSNFIPTVLKAMEEGAKGAGAPKNLHYHFMATKFSVSIKIFSGTGALVDLYFSAMEDIPGPQVPSPNRPCKMLGRTVGCRLDWWSSLEVTYRNWHSFYGVNANDHFGRAKSFQKIRVYRDFRNLYPDCTCGGAV